MQQLLEIKAHVDLAMHSAQLLKSHISTSEQLVIWLFSLLKKSLIALNNLETMGAMEAGWIILMHTWPSTMLPGNLNILTLQ